MKVLIHTDEYYPTAQACSYRMQVFVDTFLSAGDDVIVITSSANKMNGSFDSDTHNERIIYSPTIRMKKKTTIMRLLNNISFAFTSVFASIGTGRVDVVITTSPPPLVSISGWIIARMKRAKLIYDVRDIWPDVALEMGSFSEKSFFCKVFKWITGFMYKHSDVISTVSPGKVKKVQNHVASKKGKKAGSEHTDKVWLVENGFDESVVNNAIDQTIIDQYRLDDIFTCVYIGNIGLAQGLGVIIDVAKQSKYKDIQFLCFGMGAEKEMLEKRTKDEGIDNVHFCGVIDHSKVFTILSKAKISFIPLKSSNMKDSVPTKVYESLGIGCPVFLIAEGDAASIVDDVKLGVHISPDHVDKLVSVFDEMIDNYSCFDTNRENAKKTMHEKYSRQKISEGFRNDILGIL